MGFRLDMSGESGVNLLRSWDILHRLYLRQVYSFHVFGFIY